MKSKKSNKSKIRLLDLPVCGVQEVHPYGGGRGLGLLCTPNLQVVQQ
jgi:hypothetical protein